MSLRVRLLVAFVALTFLPIGVLAYGFRRDVSARLSGEYRQRLDAVVDVIEEDLRIESDGIHARLASLARSIAEDNRFRNALPEQSTDRAYLLDYAGSAMTLAGLSMLQIQDDAGRIVSSGHFRNEHGRTDPLYDRAIAAARDRVALVVARTASGVRLVLARTEVVTIGGRRFTLLGGSSVDRAFLERLARASDVTVSLTYPGGPDLQTGVPSDSGQTAPRAAEGAGAVQTGQIAIALLRPASRGSSPDVAQANIEVSQSLAGLSELLRRADIRLLMVAMATGGAALFLAIWISSRISRPLTALADKTAVLDLDRLDVEFDDGTDEVGRLSRVLGDLVERLRGSTVRVRDAERRATTGDLARQINHDIKNGLIPLRNVMRHLAQVARDEPASLPGVLAERRQTLDSSIGYLETLANNYERLAPPPDRRDCDLNALIAEVVRGVRGHHLGELRTELAPALPRVTGDPVAFRRILENLVTNALESLTSPGRVTVTTELTDGEGDVPSIRITVADTGRGMTPAEQADVFKDFYTTKEGGRGLGLSIVRRLVMDLHATVRVASEPGAGTRMTVEVPVTRSSAR